MNRFITLFAEIVCNLDDDYDWDKEFDDDSYVLARRQGKSERAEKQPARELLPEAV